MLKPTILETKRIKLVPMTIADLDGFCLAGNYPEVWQHMPVNPCQNKDVAFSWMSEAIAAMAKGKQIAFITIDKTTNSIIGSTRLLRLNEADKAIEIGHTFITPKFQRSYVNSHAKYLMLRYAFENLHMARVEICTHENNQQSRNAIARIGGHFEGILRKHRRTPNGNYRNTALFSIIDEDWPEIAVKLLSTGSNKEEFTHDHC